MEINSQNHQSQVPVQAQPVVASPVLVGVGNPESVAAAAAAAAAAANGAINGSGIPPVGDLAKNGRPLSSSKRAAQNRAAQRAFRQRKECYIKDLETKVLELKQSKEAIDSLRQENVQLRDYILALQSRIIEQPGIGGVPTPPAVYNARRQGDFLSSHGAVVLAESKEREEKPR
ncbi:hypothetical protein V1514DRAFT_333124 [Lipomyces japonicus]|uniref:uncharacterized protein n=1 Tax=Lipomyces japonicus TaxID=56871 RepID=UPI0034CE2F54